MNDKLVAEASSNLEKEIDKFRNWSNMYHQFREITGFANPIDFKESFQKNIKVIERIENMIKKLQNHESNIDLSGEAIIKGAQIQVLKSILDDE